MPPSPHSMLPNPHSMLPSPHSMPPSPHSMLPNPHSMLPSPHSKCPLSHAPGYIAEVSRYLWRLFFIAPRIVLEPLPVLGWIAFRHGLPIVLVLVPAPLMPGGLELVLGLVAGGIKVSRPRGGLLLLLFGHLQRRQTFQRSSLIRVWEMGCDNG